MNDIFWHFQLQHTKDHCSPKGAGESLKVTCQEYSLILIIIGSDEIKHHIY